MQKENIKERIFNNDDITQAQARHMSRNAGKTEIRAKFQVDRANSIVLNYRKTIQEADERMMAQLRKLQNRKPEAPQLATMARADNRPTQKLNTDLVFDSRKQRFAAEKSRNFPVPAFAPKHPAPFNFYAQRTLDIPITISIHEPDMFGQAAKEASPEREELRLRPFSSFQQLTIPKSQSQERQQPRVFRNIQEQEKHVENMYSNEYGSTCKAKCVFCTSGHARHHKKEKKKSKMVRRMPNKLLLRLLGTQAIKLKKKNEKKSNKRPQSAMPSFPQAL